MSLNKMQPFNLYPIFVLNNYCKRITNYTNFIAILRNILSIAFIITDLYAMRMGVNKAKKDDSLSFY